MGFDWTETDSPMLPDGAVVPLQQHPTYGAVRAGPASQVRRFVLLCGPRLLGAAAILTRRWPLGIEGAMLLRGPVWAPDFPDGLRRSALRQLLDTLRKRYRVVLAAPDPIDGADPLEGCGWLPLMTPATLAILDLTASPEVLRANLHSKWRNRLVRAERSELVIRSSAMPQDPDHWLLRADKAQARNRGYRPAPAGMALAWRAMGGPESARLFTARIGRSAPLAGMLFLTHGTGATYHVGWSSAAGRAVDAHCAVLWSAMLSLRDRGIHSLDLGGIDTETAAGLARFKLGTGAQLLTLGATRIAAPGTALFLAPSDRCRLVPRRWRTPLSRSLQKAQAGRNTADDPPWWSGSEPALAFSSIRGARIEGGAAQGSALDSMVFRSIRSGETV